MSDNHKYHYLSLYLNLLNKLNIKIISKDHYLPLNDPINSSNFNENYYLFHIDKKWERFDLVIKNKLKDKILILTKNYKIVLTSNIGGNL